MVFRILKRDKITFGVAQTFVCQATSLKNPFIGNVLNEGLPKLY
jgi:hypothetical protein